MRSNSLSSKKKLLRTASLALLFSVPAQWAMGQQFTFSMSKTTLGQVINAVKAQSDYQFFYKDELAGLTVDKLQVENASVEQVLSEALKGKQVTYKVEDSIIYLSEQATVQPRQAGQERVVTGQVVDANGEPLIGVNVAVKGTTLGAITDFDGNFSLKVQEGTELVVSYIGYEQQTVKIGKEQNLSITLKEDTQVIDEVVVTALGIKREKKMLGYAVQDVKGDALTSTGDAQVANALQGKVAGLSINSSTTGLGGSAKITIRGNSSLADNNQPLWIVDGVPFTEESFSDASMYGGVDRGSTSLDINPEDIESISVLKGPNAAALYGSRAGNGVILVTTKKGTRKEGFGVNYSGTFTWTQVADQLERQTLYGQGSNGVYSKDALYSWGPKLDGQLVEAWNGEQIPYLNYGGGDMREYFNTGFSQTHNVAVGNMKEDTHFRSSFGYTNSDGMFRDESLRKFNMDVNAGTKLNEYLSMDAKVSLSNTKAENRPYYGVYGEVSQLLLIPNNVRLSDLQNYSTPDKFHVNWVGPTTDYLNPYYVNQQRRNSDERWRAFGYYNLKLNFTDWLYLSAKYAFDYYRTKIFMSDLSNGTKYDKLEQFTEDNMMRSEENHFEQNAEFLLVGNNQIGEKFRVNYMAGANFMYSELNTFGGDVINMTYKNNWYWNFAANINNVTENGWRRATNSVFGSLQLAYNEYLSLDITARNDWSSTLPKHNNSYFYPSFNLGFVASDFIRNNWSLPQWLTFAKVRLSAAKVGKDASPYVTYNRWEGRYENGSAKAPVLSDTKANGDLRPETSWSYEAGLDMKFFGNRLGFDFTYYHTRTSDQIMRIPAAAPWKYQWVNSGLIVNSGVEAMIYATIVETKDFTFDLNVNMAHNNSVVEELNENKKYVYFDGETRMPIYVGAVEGGRLGDIYAKKMYKRDENGNILVSNTGEPMFVTDEEYCREHAIGNIQPKLLMSVTPTFTYKGVSLSALFDMKFGGSIVSVSEALATRQGISKRTEERGEIIVPGVNATTNEVNSQPINAETFYQSIGGLDNAVAEEFVYDASFVRLKELSVGYSFPSKLLKKTPLTALKVSFVGRNLAYLMKHTPGTSPEGGYDTSMFSQALDFSSLPYSRTFGFSVNVGF